MIEFFNIFYYLYIAFGLILLVGLYFLLRNKSEKVQSAVLFSLLLSGFILHFLKVFADYYQQWMPIALRTLTPEAICTVSILVFPWLFLTKNALLKDYMFYMGVLGGFVATIFPVLILDFEAFEFETIRYFYHHILLWVVPTLMVILKLHTLDYKRIWKAALLAVVVLFIVFINEVILTGLGFVRADLLFSHEYRNTSLIFGPMKELGPVNDLLLAFTPSLFTTVPVGPNAGETFYWPIVWMLFPAYIYACIGAFLLALPFEYKNVKRDILALRQKIIKTGNN